MFPYFICDATATGLYFYAGKKAQAGIALTGAVIDLVGIRGGKKLLYNVKAGRYIDATTKRFVKTAEILNNAKPSFIGSGSTVLSDFILDDE